DAYRQDVRLARARLAAQLENPVIAEALFLASPSLFSSIEIWREAPEGERGQKIEAALVRYFQRMATRCTPFGLCAGISFGKIGECSNLQLEAPASYRRVAELDIGSVLEFAG